MLMYLHDPNMLHNLRVRYDRDQIYTYTANILIAINPYKSLSIYSPEEMARYHAGTPHAMEPHVFGVAERCYRYMRAHKRDQSIVVSGDSGAGKTESCKYMMRYLCTVAGRGVGDLENRILEANPILEAFGNAKTLRNINSSRFGKFVEIYFDSNALVSGAAISTYLLEKSRLVNQAEGERNFHVFYQLLASGKADMLAHHGLKPDPTLYHYTSRSSCVQIANVNDQAEFNLLVQAMTAVGINPGSQALVFQTLAGLLHLGNIAFDGKELEDDDAEESVIDPDSEESVTLACKAFGCTPENLKNCLLTRTMQSGSKRGSIFTIPLRPRDAAAARDSLAKGIYGRLFDWLVRQVNAGLPSQSEGDRSISILDISGFEHFDHNGFEQFLINTCNEKIQQYFITQIMKQEQDIYTQEGLRWKKVKYNDNFETIQLLEKKRTGIMALLEESCLMPRATDITFTRKVHQVQSDHPSLMRPTACPKTVAGQPRRFVDDEAYVIRHFAADVCYNTKHFLTKNNDTLHTDLANLVQSQSGVFLKSIFQEAPDSDRGTQRFSTVSANFMKGLESLMERLHQTDSSFVRCVNPNLLQKPGLINASSVMTQLRCSGMLEALEILQAGFPTRCLFTDLYSKYRSFMPQEIQNLKPVLFCEALLVAHDLVGGADFQMGLSRVFFRAGKLAFMEELLSSSPAKVEEIVRKVRLWLARKRWKQSIWAVISINLLGKLIEDIREAKRLADEKRRLESEEYQAELRRRQEEVLRKQQEERMRREEEERREREAREARHREKMEARRREQEEMKRLRNEAAAKLDLENQIKAERDTYAELESSLRDDLATLEEALTIEQEEKSALRTQLEDQKTQNALLQQSQKDMSDELQRLRDRIAELEHLLALANARIKALQEKLDKERNDTEQVIADLENDLLDLADQKDRELAKCRKECDEAIALMRAEMEATIEKIQKAADARVQEAMTEKTKAVQKVTVEKDQQIQILEKTSTKPLKTGFLSKRGGKSATGTWQKRHFVLKSNFLAYYRSPSDPKPVGLIDLESSRVYKSEGKKKKPSKKDKPCFEFELAVPDRTYYIKAESEHDLEEWMKAINLAKARHLASVTLNLDQTSVNTARKINVQQIRQSSASPRKHTDGSEAASSTPP